MEMKKHTLLIVGAILVIITGFLTVVNLLFRNSNLRPGEIVEAAPEMVVLAVIIGVAVVGFLVYLDRR